MFSYKVTYYTCALHTCNQLTLRWAHHLKYKYMKKQQNHFENMNFKVAPNVLHFPEPLNFTKGFIAHHDGLVPAVASWCYNSF